MMYLKLLVVLVFSCLYADQNYILADVLKQSDFSCNVNGGYITITAPIGALYNVNSINHVEDGKEVIQALRDFLTQFNPHKIRINIIVTDTRISKEYLQINNHRVQDLLEHLYLKSASIAWGDVELRPSSNGMDYIEIKAV